MRLATASVAAMIAFAPAHAPADADIGDEIFGERVRQYILDHPEIILEAMEILAAREADADQKARIAAAGGVLFDPDHAVLVGAPDAPHRIVELFDYRCESCKAGHPAIEAFVAANPEVAIVVQHLPILGPQSERAARAYHAVFDLHGRAAADALHDRLFAFDAAITTTALDSILAGLGHDPAAVEAEMGSDAVTRRIDAMRDAALALGVTGTPVFLTRTRIHQGVATPEMLEAMLAAQMDE